MTKIALSRAFSGFINVQDIWTLGIDDSKAGTVGNYILPDGFFVRKNWAGEPAIFGPDDYLCEIITHDSGRPQLLWGKTNPVLQVA